MIKLVFFIVAALGNFIAFIVTIDSNGPAAICFGVATGSFITAAIIQVIQLITKKS